MLTVLLTLMSFVRVSSSGIAFRSGETWSNDATLVLSQPGYPEYRSVLPGGQSSPVGALGELVDVYAAYATSDKVISELLKRGYIDNEDIADGKSPISASAVPSAITGSSTPLLSVQARASSAAGATKLTIRATDTFMEVLRSRQVAAKIPKVQRIEVRVVKRAGEPSLVEPRSMTTPIIIFLAGLTLTGLAVFLRENMKKDAPQVAGDNVRMIPEAGERDGRQARTDGGRGGKREERDEATAATSRWSAPSSG